MSSGVSFNEDYSNYFSDINRMAYWIGFGYNLTDFVKTLKRNNEPGTVHDYISIDTQVLGMVLKGRITKSVIDFLFGRKVMDKMWI